MLHLVEADDQRIAKRKPNHATKYQRSKHPIPASLFYRIPHPPFVYQYLSLGRPTIHRHMTS